MNNKILFAVFILTITSLGVFAQSDAINNTGEVTFVTSNNVYVKFENTKNIQIGDTLRPFDSDIPCLIVNNKSSTSCVCVPINKCSIEKGDKMISLTNIPVIKEVKIQSNDSYEDSLIYHQEEVKVTSLYKI